MAENRKKLLLSLEQKHELLEQFENGESVTELAKVCGVGTECVHEAMLLG
jgi:hypothetical protein